MESDVIIINTGPLILLEKIEALEIASRLPCRFICPQAVRDELDAGVLRGYSNVMPDWLSVERLAVPVSPIIDRFLDRGEAEVIQMALDTGVDRVCLDDLRGRNIAKSVGLRVVGVLGLLAWAKSLGIIPALRPLTDLLSERGGRYSKKLIHDVLIESGEAENNSL